MLTSLASRISANPRRTLLGALLFVVLAAGLGGPVFGALQSDGGFTPADAPSVAAVERIEAATGRGASPGVLLVDRPGAPPASAAGRAEVAALAEELAAIDGVAAVTSIANADDPALISTDGRSTFLAATLDTRADEEDVATAVVEEFGDREGVEVGGSAVANLQLSEQISEDLGRAELFAFPLLVVLSLLFFRGARAALMPLAVGVTTVLGTFLLLRGINELTALSIFALNLVIGLGIGLAIDYTLLLLTRFREEMAVRGPGREAIVATMTSAGKTVVFSSATVAIALATLTLFPLGFLQSMGIGGAVVAVVAGAASLIIAPAFFAIWGLKLQTRRGDAANAAAAGRWHRLAHAVMRRPGPIAAVTIIVMLALSLPALRAVWTPVDSTSIPAGLSSRVVADTLAQDFPRDDSTPITVAAVADDPETIATLARDARGVSDVRTVSAPRELGDGTWQLDITAAGGAAGPAARAAVEDLRALDTSATVLVGGTAAEFLDQQAAIGDRLPLAVAALALLTFIVLWLMTGSVVLPIKALIMNALTVGVALGVLTLIFQDGRLEGLLGYTSNGGIEPTDFLVTAALVFALSTDYGVFLLGRIKEAREEGLGEREAVAEGLGRTGAVVTAAAILLAVAIGAFATSEVVFIQQIGVGTAVGVLVDALIVRALLVPSLMAMLGSWNWWSPAPLRRLHERIGVREEPVPAVG